MTNDELMSRLTQVAEHLNAIEAAGLDVYTEDGTELVIDNSEGISVAGVPRGSDEGWKSWIWNTPDLFFQHAREQEEN